MKTETFIAIYKKGENSPVAMFKGEVPEGLSYEPELFSRARRRVIISPLPVTFDAKAHKESEIQRLLRILVTPGDKYDSEIGDAIASGQKLLGIDPNISEGGICDKCKQHHEFLYFVRKKKVNVCRGCAETL